MRANDIIDNKKFWMDMFQDSDFAKYIENKYKMSMGAIMETENDDDE